MSKSTAVANEAVGNVRTVRAFAMEPKENVSVLCNSAKFSCFRCLSQQQWPMKLSEMSELCEPLLWNLRKMSKMYHLNSSAYI